MGRENPVYEERIKSLTPDMQSAVRKLLNYAYQIGLDARVIQGTRTRQEQQKLFDEGKTKAQPGQSYHNLKLAVDIGIFRYDGDYVYDNDVCLELLGKKALKFGLRWGGFWSHPDTPHFQMAGLPDSPTAELRKKYGF